MSGRVLGKLVLLASVQMCAKATWIEIQQAPPAPPRTVTAGQVLPPSAQPLVALWNHRTAFDIFGRPIPAQIVYDTKLAGVLVNASLRAAGTGASVDLVGQHLLVTSCGAAQYTNLQIQRAGLYFLSFSATYLTEKETVNSTHVFEVSCRVPCLPVHFCA